MDYKKCLKIVAKVLDKVKHYTINSKGEREMKLNLTLKGFALLAARESGLIPKVKGGWDDTKFNKFWELFGKELESHFIVIRR